MESAAYTPLTTTAKVRVGTAAKRREGQTASISITKKIRENAFIIHHNSSLGANEVNSESMYLNDQGIAVKEKGEDFECLKNMSVSDFALNYKENKGQAWAGRGEFQECYISLNSGPFTIYLSENKHAICSVPS